MMWNGVCSIQLWFTESEFRVSSLLWANFDSTLLPARHQNEWRKKRENFGDEKKKKIFLHPSSFFIICILLQFSMQTNAIECPRALAYCLLSNNNRIIETYNRCPSSYIVLNEYVYPMDWWLLRERERVLEMTEKIYFKCHRMPLFSFFFLTFFFSIQFVKCHRVPHGAFENTLLWCYHDMNTTNALFPFLVCIVCASM